MLESREAKVSSKAELPGSKKVGGDGQKVSGLSLTEIGEELPGVVFLRDLVLSLAPPQFPGVPLCLDSERMGILEDPRRPAQPQASILHQRRILRQLEWKVKNRGGGAPPGQLCGLSPGSDRL